MGNQQHKYRLKGITLDFIEKYVLKGRHKVNTRVVDGLLEPLNTRVYGMFATKSGTGGILPIRVVEDYGAKDPQTIPIRITGSLGNVMKESIEIAKTVCIGLLKKLEIDIPNIGLHLHFPDGATPKDGPSAGSAIFLALLSFIRKVHIPGDITFTGELDIDGQILEVGGIPEKLTGAKRAGAIKSIIPHDNKRDHEILIERIPDTEIPREIYYVKSIYDLLNITLGKDWKSLL
jgi:ATP-dependent Lon protease